MTRRCVGILVALLVLASTARNVSAQAREGITVHGSWLIEVTNADGTLAERREFENGLEGGQFLLAMLLAQKVSMGPMDVFLGDRTGVTIRNPGGNGTITVGADQASPFDNGRIAATVTTEALPGQSFPTIAVFKGRATAVRGGTLTRVMTIAWACLPNMPVESCARNSIDVYPFGFTAKYLTDQAGQAAPLTLLPEQDVKVTVTFSFSSPSGGS